MKDAKSVRNTQFQDVTITFSGFTSPAQTRPSAHVRKHTGKHAGERRDRARTHASTQASMQASNKTAHTRKHTGKHAGERQDRAHTQAHRQACRHATRPHTHASTQAQHVKGKGKGSVSRQCFACRITRAQGPRHARTVANALGMGLLQGAQQLVRDPPLLDLSGGGVRAQAVSQVVPARTMAQDTSETMGGEWHSLRTVGGWTGGEGEGRGGVTYEKY